MNKNLKVVLILTFVVSMAISIIIVIKKKPKEQIELGTKVAIMVYDDTIKDYIKTSEVPKKMALNEEKSKCIAGGTISNYDSNNGTVTYTLETADQCYLYFDIAPYHTICNDDSAACTIAKLYTADGVNDLYYHDGDGTYGDLEAGDNSYRYAGADPNNYICFKEDVDEETGKCANDNLYRIIGVIDGKAKLIKYTNDGSMPWDMKADNTSRNTWEGSQVERYLNSNEASYTYYTTKYNSSTNKNEKDQTLTKEGYLHKLGTKVNLIDDTIWSVGGLVSTNLSKKNAQEIYNLEINPETKTEYPGKIGLMYASEYMYAAEPTYWDHVAGNNATNGYNLSLNHDWMWLNSSTWTISRSLGSTSFAFEVNRHGNVNSNYVNTPNNAVHPSFSLNSNAIITVPSGEDVGSINKPYIITGKMAS